MGISRTKVEALAAQLYENAARAPLDAAFRPRKVEEHKDRLLEVTERGDNCRSGVIAASYVESAGARCRKCIVRSPSAAQSRRNDQNAIGPHSSIRLAELDASNDVLDAAVHGGSLIFISSRANDQSASGKALAVDLEE